MSDFTKLKAERKSRETKRSYVPRSAASSVKSTGTPEGCAAYRGNDATEVSSGVAGNRRSNMEVESDPTRSSERAATSIPTTSSSEPSPSSTLTSPPTSSPVALNGLYALLPPSLEVRASNEDEKGRGIWTKAARKPGDVLFSLKPHVAALSNQHLDSYCSNCFSPGTGLKRCPSCKSIYYCDSKCQTADWPLHKQECLALQRWVSAASSLETSPSSPPPMPVPSDAVRCLGRILWRRQKLGSGSIWAREIEGLQSHRGSLSKDPNTRDSQLHAHLAHALVQYLGLTSSEGLAEYDLRSAADLVDLISRFTTNTFTITTPSLTPLGACVSPAVALINHSCDPNAVIVFPRAGGLSKKDQEPLMQVIALKYINPGEEILTAYIDTTLPKLFRQQALKETYHFTCHCSLCTHPPVPVDPREAMYCPKHCGGLCRVPTEEDSLTMCTKCRSAVKDTDAVLDALRVGQEALEKAERVQFSDPPKALQLTTNLIPILTSAGVLPSAHPLLALSRLHTSLLISNLPSSTPDIEEIRSPQLQASLDSSTSTSEFSHARTEGSGVATSPARAQEQLDDAIRAATRSSTGLTQVLTPGHPVRGIALAELGKLLNVDEPAPKDVQGDKSQISSSASPSIPTLGPGAAAQNPMYPPSGPQRLKLAYETLVRARSELVVGFGGGRNEGGEVGQEMRKLAVEVEKELAVWKTGVKNALDDVPRQAKQ